MFAGSYLLFFCPSDCSCASTRAKALQEEQEAQDGERRQREAEQRQRLDRECQEAEERGRRVKESNRGGEEGSRSTRSEAGQEGGTTQFRVERTGAQSADAASGEVLELTFNLSVGMYLFSLLHCGLKRKSLKIHTQPESASLL